MKKILFAFLLCCGFAHAQNYPSPTYKNLTVNGSFTATGLVTTVDLASQAANTVLANVTGLAASPTAFAMPSCSTSTSALQYTSGTGWACLTTVANLTGAAFTGAVSAPGVTATTFNATDPGPTFTASTIYDSSKINVNSFPLTGEFGGNTVGLVQGLVGAVQIPSTSTVLGVNGVAGYARTASNTSNAVGIYGQGTMNPTTGIGNAWGGNTLVTNCANQSCSATQGVSGNEYGFEIDLNLATITGGAAPTGNARGLYINGIMNTTPSGDFTAIEVDHAGTASWGNGLKFVTGCCTNGVINSPLATGNSQNSIPNIYQSTTSGGITKQGQQSLDASGNMQITPGASALVSLNNGAAVSQLQVGGANIIAVAPIQPTYPGGIIGNVTGASVSAGSIGQVLSNTTTGTALSTGVTANCTSVSLTAGDWDVSGTIYFNPAATTTIQGFAAGINTTSATIGGLGTFSSFNTAFTTGVGDRIPTPTTQINVAATTTVYLVGQANFGTSTMTCDGFIRARRVD